MGDTEKKPSANPVNNRVFVSCGKTIYTFEDIDKLCYDLTVAEKQSVIAYIQMLKSQKKMRPVDILSVMNHIFETLESHDD
jgi:hypothetical protein